MIDDSGGTVLYSGVFGWVNLPLKNMLEEKYKVPIIVDRHTRFAALGEWTTTYNRSIDNFVYLSVSWGMSLSGFINGSFIRGRGNAGEIGIAQLIPGPQDERVRRFQELCCGQHIAEDILTEWDAEDNVVLKKKYVVKPNHMILDDIVDAALAGDSFTLRMTEKTAYNLGIAVCNVVNLFDPELVVLGGSLMEMGDIIYKPLMESVKQNLLEVQFQRVRIEMTQLFEKADLLGGAHRVLQSVYGWKAS